ncbi:uncharacterized protein BX664DRAFT_240731, partial [Halteromyces radiatus]|uniref:uncharacterized protein n=1 Tax=Halteromyces radiatus TaxID=101107 RepID=UPI00221F787A
MSRQVLIGPADDKIKEILSQQDPIDAIRSIQQQYGLDLNGIDATYPLLDLCGYSRLEIHLAILDQLNKAVITKINSSSFQLEDFYDIFDRTFPYIHIRQMQPIPMALLNKFERHIEDDILEKLKSDLTVFENCPLNIKKRIWKKDESFFQQQMLGMLNDYHHDEGLQLLAMNLKPDSYQEVIEESLCSLRVDILMNFHDQDVSEECFDDVTNGTALYGDFAMVLMDPLISNFLSSCIVRWLRKSVDEEAPENLEELISYNAKLLNLAQYAPTAVANNARIPKLDKDLKGRYWNNVCKLIIQENANTSVELDPNAGRLIQEMLNKNEVARKVFVHYLLDRVYENDI